MGVTTYGQPEPCVVIAGAGVAASVLACRLLGSGFGVVILTPSTSSPSPPSSSPWSTPVIEAMPEATVRLFAEVGLAPQLAAAGAVVVEGFENRHDPAGHRLDGVWAHVDRARLARACLTEAGRCGATLVPVRALGMPSAGDARGLRVQVGGRGLTVFAAIDATGRAARWSRPLARSVPAVATLYAGEGRASARPGRVVRTTNGWAYRLDHPEATTVGVVTRRPTGSALARDIATGLGIDRSGTFTRLGTRPACVQWAQDCVGDRRLAVGDAALAYSPLAGQGQRFALASALAAASVLESWRHSEWAIAADYYRAFVVGALQRHQAKLALLDDARPMAPAGPVDPTRRLRFGARVDSVGLSVGGRVALDAACVLDDGGLVRWVGGFDLLHLRSLVGEGATAAELRVALGRLGMPGPTAEGLLGWARRAGVLVDAADGPGAVANTS